MRRGPRRRHHGWTSKLQPGPRLSRDPGKLRAPKRTRIKLFMSIILNLPSINQLNNPAFSSLLFRPSLQDSAGNIRPGMRRILNGIGLDFLAANHLSRAPHQSRWLMTTYVRHDAMSTFSRKHQPSNCPPRGISRHCQSAGATGPTAWADAAWHPLLLDSRHRPNPHLGAVAGP